MDHRGNEVLKRMGCSFVLLLASGYAAAASLTVDFDHPPMSFGQEGYLRGVFYEDEGFRFAGNDSGLIRFDQSLNFFTPHNGGNHLGATLGARPFFERVDGSPFDLSQIDLSEYSTTAEPATHVQITGTYAGGGTVSIDFLLDGIIDGAGALADFETFVFPGTWTNLASVEMTTSLVDSIIPAFAWDNVVAVIPEPTTCSLVFVGLLAYVAIRATRKSET